MVLQRVEERVKDWNEKETAEYGEYFNKTFSDLRYISTKFNEHYDEKDPKWSEKGRVITIFEVVWNAEKLKSETILDFMLDFNKKVAQAIATVDTEIELN